MPKAKKKESVKIKNPKVKQKDTKKKNPKEKIVKDNFDWQKQSEKLMAPTKDKDEQQRREVAYKVARIYDVPLMGVSILKGNAPYLNKIGLQYKFSQFMEKRTLDCRVKEIVIEYLKLAEGKNDRAIIKAIAIFNNGDKRESIGEADQDSVSLKAVKATPNMMAETRAKNRLMAEIIRFELLEQIKTKMKEEKLSREEENIIMEAGRSSLEEMERPEELPTVNNKNGQINYCNEVKKMLMKMGAIDENTALELLEKHTELKWKDFNKTVRQYELAYINLIKE